MTITVYPNGETEEVKGHVSVFLMNSSKTDINIQCQMHTDAKTVEFDQTVEAEDGWGYTKFLTHADCIQEYSEKDFVVTATVEVPGESLKIPGGNAAPTSKFNILKNVYEQMQ